MLNIEITKLQQANETVISHRTQNINNPFADEMNRSFKDDSSYQNLQITQKNEEITSSQIHPPPLNSRYKDEALRQSSDLTISLQVNSNNLITQSRNKVSDLHKNRYFLFSLTLFNFFMNIF